MNSASSVFSVKSTVDLFAGFPVSEFEVSLSWYNQFFGCPPAFLPNKEEAVWRLAEHRYFFIKVHIEWAGHAYNLVFLSDFDAFIDQVTERGIDPTEKETLPDGTRKIIYRDPDGNEIGFGGPPLA